MARKLGSKNLNSLQRFRAKAKITQLELSNRSGVPVETISRLEGGKYKRNAKIETIGKLAEALGVEPDALTDLLEQKNPVVRVKRSYKRKDTQNEAAQGNDTEADNEQSANSSNSASSSLLTVS